MSGWVNGLRTLRNSNIAQFFLTAHTFNDQKSVVHKIIKHVAALPVGKPKKDFSQFIIEEIFTKRPYNKLLTAILLEGTYNKQLDSLKLSRECLKSLVSEDLALLANGEYALME